MSWLQYTVLLWILECMYLLKLEFCLEICLGVGSLHHCLMFFPLLDWSYTGFPDISVGKETTCNAGDPSSIPGSGWSPGEGISYLLQYSWASLVAQLLKNLPATWETWVQSLGWEDPLEKGMVTHSSILAWRIQWTVYPWGCRKSGMTEQLSLTHSCVHK